MHTHNHDHGCHSHGRGKSLTILIIAIILTLGYAIVEALFGWWANSLALLGDAGHMAADSLALIIAAFATWIATRPPTEKHSYGLGRAEVIAAWFSSLLLLIISVFIIIEAVERFSHPQPVHGLTVMVIAFLGLVMNLFIAWLLIKGEKTINIRAALLHVLSDILGSIAALISGAVIYFTHWLTIDPILSIVISILILISSIRLLRESLLVLMEGVPTNIRLEQVQHTLSQLPNVDNIHDLHICTLTTGMVALSDHIDIKEMSQWPGVLEECRQTLKKQFHIEHITLQPEPERFDCEPCVPHKK